VNAPDWLPGTALPGYAVLPPAPRAGLVLVHGIAEHGGRYRHAAAAFAARGIASFVYDQRSHGLHGGVRTHVEDFDVFAHDLETVGTAVRRQHPALPLFVWGHSMGSVVTLLAARGGLTWSRGVITSGCALDALPTLRGARGLGLHIANRLVPRLRISLAINAALLTQVESTQRAHMQDPLVPRSASLRLLHGFARACDTLKSQLPQITLPWLAIHGAADPVCPVSGSRRLIDALGSADKQLLLYPGLLHEPHNEAESAQALLFKDLCDWMLRRAGAA
jgi:alpha-beta hydrolase superfamily lysophospholipase